MDSPAGWEVLAASPSTDLCLCCRRSDPLLLAGQIRRAQASDVRSDRDAVAGLSRWDLVLSKRKPARWSRFFARKTHQHGKRVLGRIIKPSRSIRVRSPTPL